MEALTRDRLDVDLGMARRFLTALDEDAAEYTFQCFTDVKDRPRPDPLAKTMTGSLERLQSRLRALNEAGAGIFVTVNETDGKGRTKENITRVRALWQEADRGDEPDLPLEPHIVVESSPGKYHRYVLVDGMPLQDFEKTQERLVRDYGSDPSAKDRARVLRVPGFFHQKNPDNPHLVRIIHESGERPYPWEKVRAALPPVEREPRPVPRESTGELEEVRSALFAIDPDIEYSRWLSVLMAIHSAHPGDDGLALADEWSARGEKYQPGCVSDRWASFKPDGPTTIKTLFRMAHDAGWRWTHPQTVGAGGDSGDSQVNQGAQASPPGGDKPGTGGDMFKVTRRGVMFQPPDDDPVWICSPLRVAAYTRDADGESWGRLLEFNDPDGRPHRWACPMELLAADGAEFRRILLNQGLQIAPSTKARSLLATYVQTSRTDARATCTDRAGWHGDSFVLPDETVGGTEGDQVILQTAGDPVRMSNAGDLASWQNEVSRYCAGNSRLVFSLSAAFASPLLEITGDESGGINLVAESSTGKTTALKVAASAWGGQDYLHRWRATSNGLEAVAKSHNDGLLILDELGQVDPREAGEVAYMLANGTGKHRARRDGLARPAASWKLLFLSAGEIGLADHMRQAGKRAKAGQEVRLADIPADAGAGHGIYENLHGFPSGAALSDRLCNAVRYHHGHAAREYLRRLVALPRDQVRELADRTRENFLSEDVPTGADGQAVRVAGRFALIAVAGELATRMGITGWPKGEAIQAASKCYRSWLERRGGAGSRDAAEALAAVKYFIEAHGESRFTSGDTDRPTINRAGYRRVVNGQTQYLFLPEVFKQEVCKGLDHLSVARALREKGWLVIEQPGRLTIKPRDIGRVYGVVINED